MIDQNKKTGTFRRHLDSWKKRIRRLETELDSHRAPEHRRPWMTWAAWFASGALVLALLGYSQAGREYKIPSAHTSALVWEGDALWIADWFDSTIYRSKLGPSGFTIEKTYTLKDTHVIGIALAEGRLYIADSWGKRIQRRAIEEGLPLEASWPSPGNSLSALSFDGKRLWSADGESRMIYQHALDESLTVVASFAVPHRPVGLYVDGKNLWSLGAEGNRFYRHDLTTGKVVGTYELPELSEGDAPLSGFTWKGRRLWAALDGSDALLERPWWGLRRSARP